MRPAHRSIPFVLLCVLAACAEPQASPGAKSPPAATSAALTARTLAPATPTTQPSPQPLGSGDTVYGYLGKRGIIGQLAVDGSHWRGSFHFVSGGGEISIEGSATAPEVDPDAPAPGPTDGEESHAYLNCSFFAASGGGAVEDASCLQEKDVLVVSGSWSQANSSEPFYLQTSDGLGTAEYYAALLSTPTPNHECAPVADVLSFAERPGGRMALLYRLRWPCDPVEDRPRVSYGANSKPAPPPPASYAAYVADVSQAEPHRLLWSAPWTSLGAPSPTNTVTLALGFRALTPEIELYVARSTDDFQSPNTSGGNSREEVSVWAVGSDGRYGAQFELPAAESGRMGWCFAGSKTNYSTLIDLDGNKLPEIVIETTITDRHDGIDKSGKVQCVDAPNVVKFVAYQLDTKTLAWAPTAPRGVTHSRIERATRLEP